MTKFRGSRFDPHSLPAVQALLNKPRTTQEMAERLKVDTYSLAPFLERMARSGLIRKAEVRLGLQIWEAKR